MANGLNATYQAQYDALLPQVEEAARNAAQARGMFYSGQATSAETKAKADLLAKLAAQQAEDEQQQLIQKRQIDQQQSAQENQTKASERNTNLGLIGTGVGTAATLAGLYAMRGGGNQLQNMVAGGPTGYMKMVNGKLEPVPIGEGNVGGSALAQSPTSLDSLAGTGPTPNPMGGQPVMGSQPMDMSSISQPFNVSSGGVGVGGAAAPSTAAGIIAPAAPVASMWNDPLQAAGGLAGGAAGGFGGYLAANQINGGGKNTALASGLGGLAGGGAGALLSGGNPYMAAGGALLGSFGGGLLGNLFK